MRHQVLHIKTKGFTLIEVLVALFIFSILAILTMRGLQSVLSAKQKSQKMLDIIAELEIAYSIMQQDIEQIIARTALDPKGKAKLPLVVPIDNKASTGLKEGMKDEHGYNRLEFTRTGVSTTLIKHRTSDLQRLAYYQNDDMLVRHSWRQVDPKDNTLMDKRKLLSKVEKLEFHFVDNYGRPIENWRSGNISKRFGFMSSKVEMPKGVVVNFTLKDYGNIEWVFQLPQVMN